MSLPHAWARLSGPADFLHTIFEDLVDHTAVLVGIPDEIPSSALAVEIADLVKHRRLGAWDAVRSTESRATAPSESMARRFRSGNATGTVLWIDAPSSAAATAWTDHVRRIAEFPDMPRLCIMMSATCAQTRDEDKRLRRRLWRDFVTPLDSRALVERTGRRTGHRSDHIALKSALVSEIAGADLAFAEQLSRDPLGRILQANAHAHEQIWTAQVSVLLPLVERERKRMLRTHRTLWRLPYTRMDGTEIQCLNDLEIADMAAQARSAGPLESEWQRLSWLRRVRNTLAHSKVVPWATLTSQIAIQIADFR